MSTDKTRITFDYKSYHCISCFFKNKFQGVAKIHDDIIYRVEGNSIDDVKNLLINCIDEESEEDTREIFEKFHKKYIASLKNNTDISFVIDDSPLKQNRYTPGMHIPIKKFDEIKKFKPDIIIVFAHEYFSDIKQKTKFIKCKYYKPIPFKILK